MNQVKNCVKGILTEEEVIEIQDSATLALNLNAMNVPYLDLYFQTPEIFGVDSKIYYKPVPANPALPGFFCIKSGGLDIPIVSQRILDDLKIIFPAARVAAEGGSPTKPWGWQLSGSTITIDDLDIEFQRQLLLCKAAYDSGGGANLNYSLTFTVHVQTTFGITVTEASSTNKFTIPVKAA